MNPNNAVDRGRLFKAMQWSYDALLPFRNLVHGLVTEYAGSSYGSGGTRPKFEILANLLNQTVEAYTMSLVANRPRIMATSKKRNLAYFARKFETAVNNLIAEIRLEVTLRQSVLDAFFCMGIVKVHRADSIEVELESDLWADPGTPFASNVSIDNWCHDMAATKYSKVQFAADWYRIAFEDLESDIFDQSVVKQLELRPTSKWRFGEQDERLDRIARGEETDQDELVPMIDVVDVWIPRDKMIYTFPIDPRKPFGGEQKPIAVIEPDDPDAGPYDILAFHDVPENIVPSSPASHLSGMARIINSIMRKQSRKAHGQMDLFTYTPAGLAASERIQNASDQQRIAIEDGSEVGVMKVGGVDPGLQAFVNDLMATYDRMAGNLTARAGLGAQTPTAAQEQMIQEDIGKSEAAMQFRVIEHSLRIVRRLGNMLWRDKAKTLQGTMRVPGLEEYPPLDATWTPDDRQGEFSDYDMEIDLYSMPYQSPRSKFGTMIELLEKIFLPAGALLMQQGGRIRLEKVAESAARLLNAPDLLDWVDFGSGVLPPPTEESGKGAPEMGMAPSTTRNYVRRSVASGGSPQNQAAMRSQAWLGAGQGNGEMQKPQMMGA